jgi:hypothetical protein
MIHTEELNARAAGQYSYFAARDAKIRNYANSTKFSDKEKLRAEQVKIGLSMVYSSKDIFVNYRQKFITVKVSQFHVSDQRNLTLLEQDYEKEGIIKVVTDQGVVYRIPKQ